MTIQYLSLSELPNPFEINIWGTVEQLTFKHVEKCLSNGLHKTKQIFPHEDHTDVWLHAMRIAYLVMHFPRRVLEVEVQYTLEGEPYNWVLDGNHCLAACCYLHNDMVLCSLTDTQPKST